MKPKKRIASPIVFSALFSLLLIGSAGIAGPPDAAEPWKNPLEYQGKLDSPLVEVTPFVFNGTFYRLENWQRQWDPPASPDNTRFAEDEVRIRDMATDEVVSTPLIGHGLGMALVHDDGVYVFAGNWGTEKKWQITEITMVHSTDLVTWSEPRVVLRANPNEKYFNVSVCRGDGEYVLLVESNDPRWPAFTFKYFRSDDLVNWKEIPEAFYGEEKYVGGPALYYEGDYFYTLYLQSLGQRRYETRVTRSKDLVHWQDAPDSRPFATFNPDNPVHRLRPAKIRETNASDAEMVYWEGKTIVYYTGGDQKFAGDLQWAEFAGTPRELLESFYSEPDMATPTAQQLRYQNNQLGCFVHYGPAAYIGGDDYLETPDAAVFNPGKLDAEQWVRTAKSIGAKHIILTAKHHNGYCLWPTATTDYSVVSSPWKNGDGDVVAEFVDAARNHGIAPGLYISSGDMHFSAYATPDPRGVRKVMGDVEAYFSIFMEQLTELLTRYGDLEVVWFDGAYNPFDPDVLDANGKPLGERYARRITELVQKHQPNAVIMGAAEPDVRWAGSEQGVAPYPLWYKIDTGEGRASWIPDDHVGWVIPEANVHTRRHWFWSPGSDETLKTRDQMMDIYHQSIGRGANLLVNLTPDPSGRIPKAEADMLITFGQNVTEMYSNPIAEATDPRWDEGHTIQLGFETAAVVSRTAIAEELRAGQRIRGYRIEVLKDNKWVMVAEGSSVGRKRFHVFDPVETKGIRLKVTDSVPLPHIQSFSVFGPN
jgi:alpha-L-fucosidase